MCNFVGGNLFSDIRQMALLVNREEISDICRESNKNLFQLVVFVRNVFVLFLSLYRVFKSMEPLYFGSPAEIDVI